MRPSDFVARRDELAKQARGDGDRELAAAIKALRRPTVGAWYVNLASRAGLTSLRELLDLGRELRETQAAGDFAALRDLAARRGPLVDAGAPRSHRPPRPGRRDDDQRRPRGGAHDPRRCPRRSRGRRPGAGRTPGPAAHLRRLRRGGDGGPAARRRTGPPARKRRRRPARPRKSWRPPRRELAVAERERTAVEARRKEAGRRVRRPASASRAWRANSIGRGTHLAARPRRRPRGSRPRSQALTAASRRPAKYLR